MASNYRSSNDRFITKVIIGFAAVIIIIIGTLVVDKIINVEYSYDMFDEVSSYQAIEDKPESKYLVYFYGINCSHCQDIKEQVLEFAYENEAGLKVYLMESGSTTGVNNIIDPISGADMTGTPSMITVINGRIVEVTIGADDIPLLLQEINEGTYEFIN